MFTLQPYITENGVDVVAEWLDGLRDAKAVARILQRFEYLREGHFGDCKSLQEGVCEMRIDVGQGYRVYYSRVGKEVVLLLAGGNKGSQKRDIKRAAQYLNEYKRRSNQ